MVGLKIPLCKVGLERKLLHRVCVSVLRVFCFAHRKTHFLSRIPDWFLFLAMAHKETIWCFSKQVPEGVDRGELSLNLSHDVSRVASK